MTTPRTTPLRVICCAAVCVVALAAPRAVHAAGEQIPRAVLSAGATHAQDANLKLDGTVGQLIVGASAGPGLIAGHGYWAMVVTPVLGVDPQTAPARIEFGAALPNPSRGSVAFELGLPHAARVQLVIVDLQGRSVATPEARSLSAGRHRLMFTATPESPLGPGIYFTRLEVDGRVAGTRRFVRVR